MSVGQAPGMAIAAVVGSESIMSVDSIGESTLAQRSGGYTRRALPGGRSMGVGQAAGDRGVRRPSNRDWSGNRPGSGAGALTRPAPGFDRGNRRPAGGWVNNVPPGGVRPRPRPGDLSRPSFAPGVVSPGRPGITRPVRPLPPGVVRPGTPGAPRPVRPLPPGAVRPDWSRPALSRPVGSLRPGWSRPGWSRPNWIINRPVNITTVGVRPRWWGSGWATSRPWRYGWYSSGTPSSWGWWAGSSLISSLSSLASAAIIASAINNAVNDNKPTVDVKDSPYELVYGSVTPVGDNGVSFSFLLDGSAYQASADCKDGLLNSRTPDNPEEVQLLNAACQVAYASF